MTDLAPVPAEDRKLDDVLLAMDVVDTLRHRERLVAQEMDAEGREAALIERLKTIYRAQGIEVPDEVLRDGVRALEEKRFVYAPPGDGLMVRLAKLYVARDRWWKPVAAGFAAVLALAGAYEFGYAAPKAAAEQRAQVELAQTLPVELARLRDDVQTAAVDAEGDTRAEGLYQDGIDAARRGDRAAARRARDDLQSLLAQVKAEYDIRIVSRPGEYSGVFRIPDDTPDARNYYLIVEAVDAAGRVVPVLITSEEDQSTKTVTKWGVRVPQAVFERIADDKRDDQIIQAAEIGVKARGRLEPDWTISGVGGAILEW